MPQLYAFQPNGHGPSSFFVIAESPEDATVRVMEYIQEKGIERYFRSGLDYPGYKRIGPNKVSNGSYIITILNPGEVIDNDNS